jgi:glyoxylase-like metal-dependent hydrolase (beta-lactamase superfamily II)
LLVDTGTTLTEAHIVLTHKHFDHMLGSSAFVDAKIHCAPEVADYMSSATAELRSDPLRHAADEATCRPVTRAAATQTPT